MIGRKHRYVPKDKFKPVTHPGKLHRELGVPVDQPIGTHRIAVAAHSRNPAIRRDAIRAQTMAGWNHSRPKRAADRRYGK